MNVHNKIENRRRMSEFRVVGTVQHSNVQLVVVLNGFYNKFTANVVAFVDLRLVLDAIVVGDDWY